jgi:hypothetical protein
MLAKVRPSWVAAGALVLFLICAIVLSGRPVLSFSIHQVHEIATLPDDPRLEEVRRYTYAGEIPYPAGRVYRYRAEQRQPLKVGWVYSEYGVFSMPFWAQSEGGPFVYIEGAEAVRGAFLSPSQLTMLEERGSGPLPRDFSFPWYQHVWGWLLPILALIWFLLWRREDRARDAAHWADIEQGGGQ